MTVNNVAPTATFNAPGSVNEGSSIGLSLTSPSDPSSADTSAGFTYAFDCGDGSGYSPFTAMTTSSCPTTDNGSRTVKGKIKDKDGGTTEYTASVTINNVAPTATFTAPASVNEGTANDGAGHIVTTTFGLTVNNVAPTATFNAPASVNEGSNINLSVTSPSDPSTVDTGAGFTYAFDCGSGYGAFGGTGSATCSTSDNGSRSVKAKIKDKDGGTTEYTATVTINNVAPTATVNAPGSVDEGSTFVVSLTSPSDPSSVDAAAGFHYAFACDGASLAGSTYALSGLTGSASCSFDDGPSDHTVRTRIIDKDGGFTEYTADVHVKNVAPTADFSNNGPIDEGGSVTVSFSNPFDPSGPDTLAGFHYAFACDGGCWTEE